MFNEINHQYSKYKNKELLWLPCDDNFVYQHNLKNNNNDLVKYNWIDCKFTYKFNSHGFRSNEFNHDDSILFLGCSLTVGIGLPLEHTWAHQVAKTLNLECLNLSIGGTGPDTAFRLAYHYIPQIKPKLVVFLDPPLGRFSLVSSNGNFYQFVTGDPEGIDPMFKKYYEHWISLEENLVLDSIKHRLALQSLCQEYHSKFVYVSYENVPFIDYGRDLVHPGINSNKVVAELVLDRINQNN